MLYRFLCFFMLVVAVVPTRASASDDTERKAEEVFKQAFRGDLKTDERVEYIKVVVRDYGDTKWGDDALWVLARVAEGQEALSKAVVYRQQLLERDSPVKLESFTRNQKLFKTSRVSQLEYLLMRNGRIYSGKMGETERYDVMQLALHDRLGRCYEQLGLGTSSIREYEQALRLAPGKYLRQLYKKRLVELKKKHSEKESAKGHPKNK